MFNVFQACSNHDFHCQGESHSEGFYCFKWGNIFLILFYKNHKVFKVETFVETSSFKVLPEDVDSSLLKSWIQDYDEPQWWSKFCKGKNRKNSF